MTFLDNLYRLFPREAVTRSMDRTTNAGGNVTRKTSDSVVELGPHAEILGPSSLQDVARDTAQRPAGRSGRVRTRLLPEGDEDKIYVPPEGSDRPRGGRIRRPVGWLVVIEGPGTGDWFALENGLTHLGRGEDQDVCLDFGDQSISRRNHAFITYDIARHRFQLSHGESKNRTRLNDEVVASKAGLVHGDRISIGKTTLRIAAFCDDDFSWPAIIDNGGSK
jgi:hypothetical protein